MSEKTVPTPIPLFSNRILFDCSNIRLVIKELDIDPNNGNNNHGHGHDDYHLGGFQSFVLSINNIKNSNKCSGVDEKEDNDINMNA